jgi:nucleotide-binding universal stress UspA family protein
VVIEAAHQTRAQLIVLASRPGKSVLPGTVSHHVLLKAECPVMIVPSTGAEQSRAAAVSSGVRY